MSEVVDDRTTLRRLSLAVFAMCIGALGLVAIAIAVGNLHH